MASGNSKKGTLLLWNYSPPPEPVIHLNQLAGILVPRCSPAYMRLPLLEFICPVDDSFVVVDWPGFKTGFQAWWASHCTDPAKVESVAVYRQELQYTFSKDIEMVLQIVIYPFLAKGESFHFCWTVVSFNGVAYLSLPVLLISVTSKGDQSMYSFARFWAYMLLNSVAFGVMAFDDDRLALCMRDSIQLRAYITSREDAATLFKLGYLINLARNNNPALAEAQEAAILWKPVRVSRLYEQKHLFIELAKKMGLTAIATTELECLDVSSLQGMVRLHSSSSCVVRAAWKGKQVVLKMRDLSLSDRWSEVLIKTIWEGEVYMRLNSLQGQCIPTLYSVGFLHGGMFSFLMMSDARVGDMLLPHPTCPPEAALAVAQGCREAVSDMHGMGILHGDLAFSNMAVSQRPGGGYVGMLVGFSQARFAEESLLAKEWLHLERLLNLVQVIRRS
ncbi:hypothetical protein SELMODRAFT_417334 [Selaginella moellendorffii]|uniref:Protein kinase domain-containing protein n=1 Tax=Selaginella moellendorffii TaxID=88036 RepID=D8S1W5_SELML|nr:hypothetical protein SELMODRAFT_417334 [Selaginella moellendorffii]